MDSPRNHKSHVFCVVAAAGALLALCPARQSLGACAPPAVGLVAWWPGEGNALDVQGTNNGTFSTPLYAAGEVGQAFSFDGSGNNVRMPASPSMDVGAGSGMTIEAWIYSTDSSSGRPIVEWVPQTVGAFAAHFYVHQGGTGTLYANLYGTDNNHHMIQSPAGLVSLNTNQHVAVTYDKASGIARLFVNGAIVTESSLGTFTPLTSPDLCIGYRPNTVPFGPIPFLGRIDEVSLYSRALSPTEIQSIYSAGNAGKCLTAPPFIFTQPTSQTLFVGGTATFAVLAGGTQPLSYQWTLEGTNLPGATSASLLITNAQTGNGGTYAVVVTNGLGSILSSNAVLTVNPPPPCTVIPSSVVAWWPAEGNAGDLVGTDNGTLMNGITFVPGEVGKAFNFDGTSGAIIVPGSPTLNVQDLTIETWIFPTDVSSPRPIFEYANVTGLSSLNFWYGLGAGAQPVSGALFGFARDATNGNNNFYVASAGGLLPANQWSHVAFSFDSATRKAILYLNGQSIATNSFGIPVHPNTLLAVNLGYRPVGSSDLYGGRRHLGKLDEVTVYGRALAANEIQAIYNASISGKCSAPIPPYLVAQPTNQTVLAGSTVNLVIPATGGQPLSYQWSFNGTNLVGQTNALLTLSKVQVNQTGNYSVLVTNLSGSDISSNAVLTVNPPPPCAAPPVGLVGWWPGEANANDNEGANNGVFSGASYGSGEVGQAFNFDGSGNNVRIPASASMDVGAGNGMTIEAWVYPNDTSGRPVVEWVPSVIGNFGTHFWLSANAPGALYANLYDTANVSHIIETGAGAVAANKYQHVAVTYDKASGTASLYVNGAQVVQSALGTFTPQTSPDLVIGLRPNTVPFGPTPFLGKIDEVSLYSRALGASEIKAIYDAGGAGKCSTPVPPSIFLQPSNQTATIGQSIGFQVQAGGTWPLSYQWSFNNTAIIGTTNASLVLTNVQMSQAGTYSVLVTNAYGSATSSNATLVVNFPPAPVNLVSASGVAGQQVTVPVVLVANGNENAVGFSVNFSPTLLTNLGVTLGSGANGAALVVNPNTAGTLGVGVALPSGSTFAPGTQEVAEISFVAAISSTNYSTALSFGDQPTKRLLADAKANVLPANFNGGQVSLTRSSFEADVSPRPDGDGEVTVSDWVQVGRFVAALDVPGSPSEFQRADCAPRNSAGDGLLTVSDWVQAGRYTAGLDPLTVAAGPTVPASGQVVTLTAHRKGTDPQREVSVIGPLLFQGQTATATVELEAQGDENGVGFSLAFDPTVVNFAGYTAGADTLPPAMIDVNSNQATNGQVGIILALPTGTSFAPGTRQLLKINFQALTTNSVNSALALTDLPVRREVADTNAVPVVTVYTNGLIEVNPKPALAISHASQTFTLSWPSWATNYNLQQAISSTLNSTTWSNLSVLPVLTNNSENVTLPVTGSVQFYRLQHQ